MVTIGSITLLPRVGSEQLIGVGNGTNSKSLPWKYNPPEVTSFSNPLQSSELEESGPFSAPSFSNTSAAHGATDFVSSSPCDRNKAVPEAASRDPGGVRH